MSITVCTFIKRENNYIDEWLSWHLSIGVDKFIIYDNNDGREDYPMTDFVSKKVMEKKVKVIYKRNETIDKNKEWKNMYNMCMTKWMVFLDVDEYIKLNNEMSINEWLNQEKFNDADNIRVSVKCFSKVNNEFTGDYSIQDRLKLEIPYPNRYNRAVKTFIKCGHEEAKYVTSDGVYAKNTNTIYCNGTQMHINIHSVKDVDFSEIEIDAYPTKTMEEFCFQKIGRNRNVDNTTIDEYKKKYFEVNRYSVENEQKFEHLISKAYGTIDRNTHSYAMFDFGDGQSNDAK